MRRALVFLVLVSMPCGVVLGDPPSAAKALSFRADIAPILVKKCLGCHNDNKATAGLNMATFALLKKGGKGAGADILVPGDPDASHLIESIRADATPRMPFKLAPLSDPEIRTLERWVKEGAKFDGPSATETPIASLFDPLAGLPRVALKAGASDPVAALAFSPDGKLLAVGRGRRVAIQDATTGKTLSTSAELPGPINHLDFTPDGRQLIAAGGRPGMFGTVAVLDAANGKTLREIRGHNDTIQGADLSPDGSTLATGSYDRTVILWEVATGRSLRTLRDHTDAIYAVAFSPDGKTLATAGADRTVKVWDVATGKKLETLNDATAELYAVAFSTDGTTVFAGGVDRSIRAWRVAEKGAPLVGSAFAHDGAVLKLVVASDGKTLVSAGEDRDVKLWELPTLRPRKALDDQPDWPQSIALNREGTRLSVGRHDGTLALLDIATGQAVPGFQTVGQTDQVRETKPPQLVRNASLNPPSPRGTARGTTRKVTLTGNGVGNAAQLLLPEKGVQAKILKSEKPDANRLDVEIQVAPDARVGLHQIGVVTPLGVPAFQSFAVDAHPERPEAEPNDTPEKAPVAEGPFTLVGLIEKPGDVDLVRIPAKAGRPIVAKAVAKALGSNLLAVLALQDENGRTLAEAVIEEGTRDPILTFTPERDGLLTLKVTDADYGGSGAHIYRISVGEDPHVRGVFPTGIARGQETSVRVEGVNLGGSDSVAMLPAPSADPGSLVEVPLAAPLANRRSVVVADGPQAVEAEPNDASGSALKLPAPGGASGRIDRPGDVDLYRFYARNGERWIVEVFGRRIGSPIDPVLEVLDAQGKPVPRAVLRPVAETEIAFRDHNAANTGIRLTRWNNLAINDMVLIGREVTRIFALPKNPDDDCQFWSESGQRFGFLETTPEHHPMGQPIYKVEVHPPGTTFPTGGVPPVTLYYRNDDGGPSFNKDARLTFDAPAEGDYLIRLGDVRGVGGSDSAYHLIVRRPRPDYQVSLGVENPNIHRGGTLLVPVMLTRIDGFEDPVEVQVDGLPPGITATPVVVEREANVARLALTASSEAPAFSPPTWKIRCRSIPKPGESSGQEIRHELDPGGPAGGLITVMPEPNLVITPKPDRVTIRPGREVTMKLTVARSPAFKGRVPIEVRNLPHGVRVLNIGLNGVLVTESQTERTVTLYAEPWVEPMTRPFYAVGKAEAAGTEHSTGPIMLVVAPAGGLATRP